jgi:hypothetical protein
MASIRMPRWRVPIMEAAAGLAGESGPARKLVDAELEKFRTSTNLAEKNLVQALKDQRGQSKG